MFSGILLSFFIISSLPFYNIISEGSSIFTSQNTVIPTLMPTLTSTPTPSPTPTPTPTKVPLPTAIPTNTPIPLPAGDYEAYFDQYSNQYGVDKNILKKIAICESGLNPGAVNGPYGGMFQFLAQTWSSTRNEMGLDANPDLRFSAEESIKTAAFKISRGGIGAWGGCL